MKTYTVRIPEVHYCYVVVEARNKTEAIEQAMSGQGDYGDDCQIEYAYTLEDETKYQVLED